MAPKFLKRSALTGASAAATARPRRMARAEDAKVAGSYAYASTPVMKTAPEAAALAATWSRSTLAWRARGASAGSAASRAAASASAPSVAGRGDRQRRDERRDLVEARRRGLGDCDDRRDVGGRPRKRALDDRVAAAAERAERLGVRRRRVRGRDGGAQRRRQGRRDGLALVGGLGLDVKLGARDVGPETERGGRRRVA